MPTVDFTRRVRWGSINNQGDPSNPKYSFTLFGDNGVDSWPVLGTIDTGATYLMINEQIAVDLKLDFSTAQKIDIVIADGRSIKVKARLVDIEVLGKIFQVLACFGPFPDALIGQVAINEIMRFGTDEQGWLWTLDKTVT